MKISVIVARVLVAYTILAFLGMLLMSGWGEPPRWTVVAPVSITLAVLACPTSLILKSRIAEVGVVLWLVGLLGIMLFLGEWTSSFVHVAVLFGLIAKPTLVGIAEWEKRKASNHQMQATVDPRTVRRSAQP